ncbi:hypothetical protein NL676_036343 [Syzygium grande]|nr:hypothetical protein NL676_036343 [Syzygium grande]
MGKAALRQYLWISVCVLLLVHARSFHLSDVAPQDFQMGEALTVKVNPLTSTKLQFPHAFYSLGYCRPLKMADGAEKLGKFLRGDHSENSPYEIRMGSDERCKILCRRILNAKEAKDFKENIDDEYRVNMILDNLPLVVPLERTEQKNFTVYQRGFPVGFKGQYAGTKEQKHFIYNHVSFTVKYHLDKETKAARIVGFEVKPFSVKHTLEHPWGQHLSLTTCDAKQEVTSSETPQEVEDREDVVFTYDVHFQASDVKRASRWETYRSMADDLIHWFSIATSGGLSKLSYRRLLPARLL